MEREIELRASFTAGATIETIYFGGGTPSLLSADQLQHLFESLHANFDISPSAEITLEANPDDLSKNYLKALVQTPINRLSIGVQSFRENDLRWMNRAHTAEEALGSIREAREIGFAALSIDLIYGLPGLENRDWRDNLTTALSLELPHLSTYCLTVEEGTALGTWVACGKEKAVDEEAAATQFEILCEELHAHNYEHYEISNACKRGHRARHNSAYWTGETYLGVGPGAHSFDGKSRYWNISSNHVYIEKLSKGETVWEKEQLSEIDRINAQVMTGLRTSDGLDMEMLVAKFGAITEAAVSSEASIYLNSGHLRLKNTKLILTRSGRLIADRIMSDLFLT